jgi:hypothetical protein
MCIGKFLPHMSKLFTANRLALSLDKTKIMFITNTLPHCALSVEYNENM